MQWIPMAFSHITQNSCETSDSISSKAIGSERKRGRGERREERGEGRGERERREERGEKIGDRYLSYEHKQL